MRPIARVLLGTLCAAGAAQAMAQAMAQGGGAGIYTCTDGRGRRLTSDRPIAECIDREQRELNPSGTVLRRVAPTPTAIEQAAEDDRQRRLLEERNHAAEDKRRNRALLTRYPNQASHDKERIAALSLIDELIATAHKRQAELGAQREKLEGELEFYKDKSKVPQALRRALEQTEQQRLAQDRYVIEQQQEKVRVAARFDDELARLRGLWAQQAVVVAPARATASR